MKKLIVVLATMLLAGCATIVNDPNIPLTVSFSDGSAGQCTFKNKRGTWTSEIPTTNVMIRRSDDALNYSCSTEDGRQAEGSIQSEMEGGKMAASVVFWDLGITDAITDKHRTYQGNVVIPVEPIDGAANDVVVPSTVEGTLEKSETAGASIEDRLKELDSLSEQGLITEEEYKIRRAEILQDL